MLESEPEKVEPAVCTLVTWLVRVGFRVRSRVRVRVRVRIRVRVRVRVRVSGLGLGLELQRANMQVSRGRVLGC